MRFEFWTTPGHSHLKAVLEDDEDGIGRREEGDMPSMTLKDFTATFDYEVRDIHPDVLGLLCMIVFFPFIKSEVEFPKPVSERLVQAFSLPIFKSRKELNFRNVSSDVEPYSGDRIALSFGGGIDSSGVRAMFPEAFLVHEVSLLNGQVRPDHTHEVVTRLGPDKGKLVTTNCRYMTQEGGWHTWPCSTSTSLLLATDMGFGIILIGSVLGSTFLHSGVKYFDRLAAREFHGYTGNFWQSAFGAIGLPLFSPVGGVSGLQTLNQSRQLIEAGDVTFCQRDNGNNCLKCPKCFRRDAIRAFLFEDYVPNWDAYSNEEVVAHLIERPLYFGHIYSAINSLTPRRLPTWVRIRLKDVAPIESDWLMRSYPAALEFCPPQWRQMFSDRIDSFMDRMTSDDIAQMKAWSQEAPEKS